MFDVFDRMVDYERGRHYTVDHVTGEVYAVPFCVHCESGGSSPPPPSPEQLELMRLQLEEAKYSKQLRDIIMPYMLGRAGLRMTDKGLEKMSEEEYLGQMSDAERQQYELSRLAAEKEMQALRGELPLSQAVEQEIAKQRGDLESYMASKLGPNWRQSTPGIQALTEFERKANALREEQQYCRLSGLSALNMAQQGGLASMMGQSASYAQSPLSASGGIIGNLSAALQPYQYQQQLQYQANLANAQSKSGMMAGLGSLLGTGLMAGASYFGGPAAAAGILASRGLMGSGPYAYGGFGP